MLAIGTAELHCRELMKGANVERIEKWSARMKEWRRHSPFLDIKLGLRERWRHGKQYSEKRQVTWCALWAAIVGRGHHQTATIGARAASQ